MATLAGKLDVAEDWAKKHGISFTNISELPSNKKFQDKYDFPYRLLSDPEQKLAKAYATVVTYPLQLAQSKMRADRGGKSDDPNYKPPGTFEILARIYNDGGNATRARELLERALDQGVHGSHIGLQLGLERELVALRVLGARHGALVAAFLLSDAYPFRIVAIGTERRRPGGP